MMRAILSILVFVLLLSGCDGPEIKACEDYIIAKLRSPSTYKRINADGINVPYKNPNRYNVIITYDAANAYGTPVRDSQVCVFSLNNGKPDMSKYYDFDNDFDGVVKDIDQAVSDAENAAKAAEAAANAVLRDRRN